MPKIIYHYAPDTGLFLGTSEADESPMEKGVYLIPGFATDVEPPSPGEHETVAFSAGTWVTIPDWRGVTLYSTGTGNTEQIEVAGVTPDQAGLTISPPPAANEREAAFFKDGAWSIVPDWRGAKLFSTADGTPVSVNEIGKTPADIEATEHPMPSPAHAWDGRAWKLDAAKKAALLIQAKVQALNRVDQHHADVIQKLVGNPTQVEKDTWAMKLGTANAIAAGQDPGAAGIAFLAAASLTETQAKAEWAASVLRKSAGYATVVGLAERLRETTKTAVNAAATTEEIELVLSQQKAAADQAVAKLLGAG